MSALTVKQILDAVLLGLTPERKRTIQLCAWATEVLRRECPVYWL